MRSVKVLPLVMLLLTPGLLALATASTEQNDAGSGGDAGDTFATATPVTRGVFHHGELDAGEGDAHDYYRFHVMEGSRVAVRYDIRGTLQNTDPVTLLDPSGNVVAVGVPQILPEGAVGLYFAGDKGTVVLESAPVTGIYRLHVKTEVIPSTTYSFCILLCETVHDAPIGTILSGSPRSPLMRILLQPPTHGDLGNPLGPTAADYIQATLRGIHNWEDAIDAFTAKYPEYAHLQEIRLEVLVLDEGVDPTSPVGYDTRVTFLETTGPMFRGKAGGSSEDGRSYHDIAGHEVEVRQERRDVLLSLFANSPRAGQPLPDYPEVVDLEAVTMHEFGHSFGLGHTSTWTEAHGPDLMNSPAPFIFGDGNPVGDGGERTTPYCISSLDLYGLAHLYRWIPSGEWEATHGGISLPAHVPYELYC